MSIFMILLMWSLASFLVIWCVIYLFINRSKNSPRIGAYIIIGIVVLGVLAISMQYFLYGEREVSNILIVMLFLTAFSSISYLKKNSRKND